MSIAPAFKQGRRSVRLGWILWSVAALIALELFYLAWGNFWLPRRFVGLAKRADLELRLTGFRTLYPGEFRLERMALSGGRFEFNATAQRVRGRLSLGSLLSSGYELVWFAASEVEVRVPSPAALVTALSQAADNAKAPIVQLGALSGPGDAPALRVAQASLDLRDLQLGGVRFRGPMKTFVHGLELRKDGVSLAADVHFSGLKVAHTPNPDATSSVLEGQLALRVGDGIQVTSKSTSPRLEIARLFGATSALGLVDARLDVMLRLGGRENTAPSTIELVGSVLRDESSGPNALIVRNPRLRLRLTDETGGAPKTELGHFELSSPRIELTVQQQRQQFSCKASGKLEQAAVEPFGIALSDTTIHVERGEPALGGALQGELVGMRATWSGISGLSLSGHLTASGSDAGTLLDLGQAAPGARWMLSEIEGTPFQLALELDDQRGVFALEDVAITTARDSANGAMYLSDTGLRGALLVQRASFQLGIVLSPEGMRLETQATDGWLRETLARLPTELPRPPQPESGLAHHQPQP